MKYKTFLIRGKDRGKNVTNRIEFSSDLIGTKMSEEEKSEEEWHMFEKAGGLETDQRIFKMNPYKFARYSYTMWVDPDKIVMRSTGADRQERVLAFNMMTDPRVAPFTDQQAVVNDFVIEEFGGNDPDKYKKKGDNANDMMSAVMGQNASPNNYKYGGGLVVPPQNSQVQ